MGKLLVVGSVALDTVKTPFGEASEVLGGSATYFATAASYFTSVDLIAVVGEDFPDQHLRFLKSRGIDLTGLERRAGETFRWKGEYSHQLNEAHTLDTRLNVFETFRPKIPDQYRSPSMLFLGNIDPELQLDVLRQVRRPMLVACDTMNFWIERKREALWRVLEQVDVLIINDGEARALGGHPNLTRVARETLARGPKHLVIKRGEYGSYYSTTNRHLQPLHFRWSRFRIQPGPAIRLPVALWVIWRPPATCPRLRFARLWSSAV